MQYLPKKALTLGRVGLGAALLYYVLSLAGGWSAVKQAVSAAWVLAWLAALPLLGAAIEAKRMSLLLESQGLRLPLGYGYRLVAMGAFFACCLPGGTGGDVVKLYYLAAQNRGRTIEVATVLLVDRALALFSMLFLAIGLALLDQQLVRDYAWIRSAVAGSAAAMGVLLLVAGFACSAQLRGSGLRSCPSGAGRIVRLLARASEAVYAFRNHKTAVLLTVSLCLLGHLTLAGMFLALKVVIMPGATALQTCVLAFLGMLVNALPITPGGLGVAEAAFEGLFRMVGHPGGAQLMLAWRFAMLPLYLVGCLFYVLGTQTRPYCGETAGQALPRLRPSPVCAVPCSNDLDDPGRG